MKIVKTQVIMYMYEKLLLEGKLDPVEVKKIFELTNKTFYRYIQEIKAYCNNTFKNVEIIYSRSERKYFFVEKYI